MLRTMFFAVVFLISMMLASFEGFLVHINNASYLAHPPFMAAVLATFGWGFALFMSASRRLG